MKVGIYGKMKKSGEVIESAFAWGYGGFHPFFRRAYGGYWPRFLVGLRKELVWIGGWTDTTPYLRIEIMAHMIRY